MGSSIFKQQSSQQQVMKPCTVNNSHSDSSEGYQDTISKNVSNHSLMSSIKAFESKSRHTSLSDLTKDAKQIFEIFKSDPHIIRDPNINITFKKWTGDNNHMYKIRLYTSDAMEVLIHVFSTKFKETSYHNHYKPMILQNISGEYIHTVWMLDCHQNGTLYKFQKKHGEPLPEGQRISGKLIKGLQHNYKCGNLTYIDPSWIHTVKMDKESSNKDPVISFTIRSNFNLNEQQFVISNKWKLPQEETIKHNEIPKDQRDEVLQLIIDAICN